MAAILSRPQCDDMDKNWLVPNYQNTQQSLNRVYHLWDIVYTTYVSN